MANGTPENFAQLLAQWDALKADINLVRQLANLKILTNGGEVAIQASPGASNAVLDLRAIIQALADGATGMQDPMTTIGDIIQRDATNTTARLGIGTLGQVPTVGAAGVLEYQTPTGSDPMTTIGDLVHRNASNVTARLPIGAQDEVLTVDGGLPVWKPGTGGGGASDYTLVAKTTATNYPDNTELVVVWDSAPYNEGGLWTSGTDLIIPSGKGGLWSFDICAWNEADYSSMAILVNAGFVGFIGSGGIGVFGAGVHLTLGATLRLADGDVITLACYGTNASAADVVLNRAYLAATRIGN